jgi:hypothetical protein
MLNIYITKKKCIDGNTIQHSQIGKGYRGIVQCEGVLPMPLSLSIKRQ